MSDGQRANFDLDDSCIPHRPSDIPQRSLAIPTCLLMRSALSLRHGRRMPARWRPCPHFARARVARRYASMTSWRRYGRSTNRPMAIGTGTSHGAAEFSGVIEEPIRAAQALRCSNDPGCCR
jgi:hypothetical protein